MSGKTEIIDWYYISEADYQRLMAIGAWGTTGTNPFEEADFNETFPDLPGYHFARKSEIDEEEHNWAIRNDIIIGSTAFAESNQSGVIL